MNPPDDRIAKRLEEIRAQESQLDREATAQTSSPAGLEQAVVRRRQGGAVRSLVAVVGILVLGMALLELALTLNRHAGDDMADARREGQATVTSCQRHGPVTAHGFGYWFNCAASITWDGGQTERLTVGDVFSSADIGTPVVVGDLGGSSSDRQIARADRPSRPWLSWAGYAVGAVAVLPIMLGALLLFGANPWSRRSLT